MRCDRSCCLIRRYHMSPMHFKILYFPYRLHKPRDRLLQKQNCSSYFVTHRASQWPRNKGQLIRNILTEKFSNSFQPSSLDYPSVSFYFLGLDCSSNPFYPSSLDCSSVSFYHWAWISIQSPFTLQVLDCSSVPFYPSGFDCSSGTKFPLG